MKKVLFLFFIHLCISGFAQPGNFNMQEFSKKTDLVRWLYWYDMVAWITTDSVMLQPEEELRKMGQEWFCYRQDDMWHAFYGKLEGDNYQTVFHYTTDNEGKISRNFSAFDTLKVNRHAIALRTALNTINPIRDTLNIRFNHFIRQNEDSTFNVWIFPAFQPNSVAIYGREFIYTLDKSGRQIIADDSYFQGSYRGFKVDNPREIWLNYTELEQPTLGSIFFGWYYKSYFTKIMIENAGSISSPIKTSNDWTWITVLKEKDKKKKKSKKKK